MFGETSYRYPKTVILLSAVKDLSVLYILQVIIILRWQHLVFGQTSLLLISALPCLTIILAANKMVIYYKMYDMACNDPQVQQTLLGRPDIDKEDYLLWATMEAFNLYKNAHYNELQDLKEKYVMIACFPVLLQIIFEPLL